MEYLSKMMEIILTPVISFFVACVMALMRTKKNSGKADFLEGGMCGLFAVGVWSFLDWFNIPQLVAVGVSSAIGYMGTSFVSRIIEKKVDLDND